MLIGRMLHPFSDPVPPGFLAAPMPAPKRPPVAVTVPPDRVTGPSDVVLSLLPKPPPIPAPPTAPLGSVTDVAVTQDRDQIVLQPLAAAGSGALQSMFVGLAFSFAIIVDPVVLESNFSAAVAAVLESLLGLPYTCSPPKNTFGTGSGYDRGGDELTNGVLIDSDVNDVLSVGSRTLRLNPLNRRIPSELFFFCERKCKRYPNKLLPFLLKHSDNISSYDIMK